MTKSAARVIVGRYRLIRPVGRGGMGAVWQAHDTLLGRDVAIKEIWLPSANDEPVDPADPLVRRALREAQAAARLRHPSIVTVHDVVTDAGRPWIVMELINGRSLAEAIREHGLLTERRTAEIGLQVVDALRAAHREGIAHRDVKPANILLDDADRVVLTDFGIAAIDDATALTATGQMVGSPAYLAPERINGLPATAAGDLWALGVTLYTTVTGRSPFQREDTQATFAAILTSRPTPPAHSGRLWPVIKDLLIKDPARRLSTEQTRKLLANVVEASAAPQPAGPAPGGLRSRWWPAQSKRREATPDDMPGTLAAPTPTLAAPTAYQQPRNEQAPEARPATPPRLGSPSGKPAAAARPGGTVPAANAQATVVPGPAPTEAVAAQTVVPDTAAVETVAADRVVPEMAAAETVSAAMVPAETIGLVAVPAIPDGTPPILRGQAVAAVPLAPYPEIVRRPRTIRARTAWFAALAVGSVLLTGGILRTAWPESDDRHTAGGESASAGPGLARGESAKPAPTSATSSVPANPSLDSCLVGTWQDTSMQFVVTVDGVNRLFTSPGGHTLRIWPDGKSVEDYTKNVPARASFNGAKWTYAHRGVQTSHVETRGGREYSSEITITKTNKMTRNGKALSLTAAANPSYNLPYICSETRLTTYGNEKISTDSYKRISHTP